MAALFPSDNVMNAFFKSQVFPKREEKEYSLSVAATVCRGNSKVQDSMLSGIVPMFYIFFPSSVPLRSTSQAIDEEKIDFSKVMLSTNIHKTSAEYEICKLRSLLGVFVCQIV